MKKKRILILCNIIRRDIGSAFVLSKLLEGYGHKCFIAGYYSYSRIDTKMWNPEAIVVLSVVRVLRVKKLYPNAKIFYIPGEGGENYPNCEERILVEKPEIFNAITKIFLWGNNAIENIENRINELGDECAFYHKKDFLYSKIKIVGQPRFDLVKYAKQNQNNNDKINVGFIGNFSAINNITDKTALFKIFSGDDTINQQVMSQVNMARLYCDILKKLDKNKYNFSIRPYPAESIIQYMKSELVIKYSVDIDESYDFGTWISKQDLIIGPTSSTYGLIASMKKPLILIDFVNNSRDESEYKISMSKLFHSNIELPRNIEQVYKMINNFRSIGSGGAKQEDVLDKLYSTKMEGSVLSRISKEVNIILESQIKFSFKFHIPLFLLKMMDRFIFIFKENKNSYDSFCYSKNQDSLNVEFEPVIKKIIKSR